MEDFVEGVAQRRDRCGRGTPIRRPRAVARRRGQNWVGEAGERRGDEESGQSVSDVWHSHHNASIHQPGKITLMFVANLEEETGYEKNNDIEEHASGLSSAIDSSEDEISLMVKDMLDSSDRAFKSKALDRYRSIGEQFYQEACKMDEKVKRIEAKIRRRYFDATPLDNDQLNNWHLYLDFIETENNMDWAMKLYERCLIPCAT